MKKTKSIASMKSIASKIYPLFVIIFVMVFVFGAITNLGLKAMKGVVQNLSEEYLELQVQNEIVSRNVAEGRLYNNLMVLMNNENSTAMAGMVPGITGAINDAMTNMKDICEKLGEAELTEALSSYETELVKVVANIDAVANCYLAGDIMGAVAENGKLYLTEFSMPEPEFSKTNINIFGSVEGSQVEVETDGENPQHIGVLNAWGGAILRGTPLVADGSEGINGLTISNAMHLSAFLGREVEIPFDEDVFYDELIKRVATSRRKTAVTESFADTSGTYGGAV